jgi:hypothetical protein
MPRQLSGIKTSIANTAARLMAEDGITDLQLAKRKAVKQLGLPEHTALPDNAEVEAELHTYRSIFPDEEHDERLLALRQTALVILELLTDFRPYLTGSVLDGTANEHSNIDIFIFADSAKEVEIFLLNRKIEFDHVEPRNDKAEAVLVMETDTADANLVIFPQQLERVSMKYRDGRPRERIRADALRALIAE